VFSTTDRASFEHLPYRLNQLRDYAHKNVAVSLVGNKCDREEERQVSMAEGLEFAESHGMDFVESSAKLSINVETAFRRLIMAVAQLLPEGKERERRKNNKGSPKSNISPDELDENDLPVGWIKVPSQKRPGAWSWENIWTGERISHAPVSAALEYNSIQVRGLISSLYFCVFSRLFFSFLLANVENCSFPGQGPDREY